MTRDKNMEDLKHNDAPVNSAGGRRSVDSTRAKAVRDSNEALELALSELGHFGLYHRYALFLLCIPNLFAAMYSLNYVFVADVVPFR